MVFYCYWLKNLLLTDNFVFILYSPFKQWGVQNEKAQFDLAVDVAKVV